MWKHDCRLSSFIASQTDYLTHSLTTPHSDVCTKYQEASKIVNLALEGIVAQCLPGAKVLDICEFGHTVIEAQTAKLFTKKVNGQVVDRGVAFPVCISVNDIVCNLSPLPTEEQVSVNTATTITRSCHGPFQVRHDGLSISCSTGPGEC